MDKGNPRFSTLQIVAIAALAVGTSLAASYLVQRFVLDKPEPKIHVAVILGTVVPLVYMLKIARRRSR